MFYKFICELLCQKRDSSPSFFHKNAAKKRKRWIWVDCVCAGWGGSTDSLLSFTVLLHKWVTKGPLGSASTDVAAAQDSLGTMAFMQELFWLLLDKRREIEKDLKIANSNSWLMCCCIISACVKYTDSKHFSLAILCVMTDLLPSHLLRKSVPSAQAVSILSYAEFHRVFQWIEILQCLTSSAQMLRLNSLGLLWSSSHFSQGSGEIYIELASKIYFISIFDM